VGEIEVLDFPGHILILVATYRSGLTPGRRDPEMISNAHVKHVVDFQSAASRACLSASSPDFL
jgi:hypothetical protein